MALRIPRWVYQASGRPRLPWSERLTSRHGRRYTISMTQTMNQTRKALRDNETQAMALLQEIMAAGDIDTAAALLERITKAATANTAQDIAIDLRDMGETEASEIVKENWKH